MPLVLIHCPEPPDPAMKDAALAAVSPALCPAVDARPEAVMTYWVDVSRHHVRDELRTDWPAIPAVIIHGRTGRTAAQIEAGMRAVAGAVGDALGLPVEDVWVRWDDMPLGHVLSNGVVV